MIFRVEFIVEVRSKLGVFLVYRKENNCSSIQLFKKPTLRGLDKKINDLRERFYHQTG